MKIVNALLGAVRAHRVMSVAFATLFCALVATLVVVMVVRQAEVARLERAATKSSELLIVALSNPAIFTAQPDTAVAELNASSDELSRVHDGVVLEKVYFAKKADQAALAYTEYNARIGRKLTQVALAQQRAGASSDTYEHNVEVLKASNLALRGAAQEDVNAVAGEARASTELAFQECALLVTLTDEFEIIRAHALTGLPNLGPDVQAAITALKPSMHAALEAAHARRKPFNPAAHAPS